MQVVPTARNERIIQAHCQQFIILVHHAARGSLILMAQLAQFHDCDVRHMPLISTLMAVKRHYQNNGGAAHQEWKELLRHVITWTKNGDQRWDRNSKVGFD